MRRFVLDASALMFFFDNRAGGEVVEELVHESLAGKVDLSMSVVNWGEVYYSAWQARGDDAARRIAAETAQLPIELVNADFELTKSAAELRAKYRLPYADCFAAALTKVRAAELLTSDRDFAKVRSEINIQFL